jgi:hypothetical protein
MSVHLIPGERSDIAARARVASDPLSIALAARELRPDAVHESSKGGLEFRQFLRSRDHDGGEPPLGGSPGRQHDEDEQKESEDEQDYDKKGDEQLEEPLHCSRCDLADLEGEIQRKPHGREKQVDQADGEWPSLSMTARWLPARERRCISRRITKLQLGPLAAACFLRECPLQSVIARLLLEVELPILSCEKFVVGGPSISRVLLIRHRHSHGATGARSDCGARQVHP